MLEVNAHVALSKRLADLTASQRTTEVLDFILNSVKPPIIVCAGKSAFAAVQKLQPTWTPSVIQARHFIYWGFAYENALADKVNEMLKG